MGLYKVYNAAVPTVARMTPVATGTSIKTMIQITAGAADRLTIVAYGASYDGAAAVTPGSIELIETGTVAGTGHTVVVPTIMIDGDGASSAVAGFTPTAEGSIAGTPKVYDAQLLPPTGPFAWEWSQGSRPVVGVNKVLRLRVHTPGASVTGMLCWVMWED